MDEFLQSERPENQNTLLKALSLLLGYETLKDIPDRLHLFAAFDRLIVNIDSLIFKQVDAILHHPRFQRMEASWRGVYYLVNQFHSHEDEIVLRIINWKWIELSKDLEGALEFDQSYFFRKIYTEEIDSPGGKPFGVLLGDYYISPHRHETVVDDVATLSKASEVAAASFCPFVISCRASMFGLDHFSELEIPSKIGSDLSTPSNPDYRRWQQFRDREESRFIGIVLPRILMRLPYGPNHPDKMWPFYREQTEGMGEATENDFGNEEMLWGNAVYAFGGVLIRAFKNYGWFADIRGLRLDELGGGTVIGFPVPSFDTDAVHMVPKFLTEIAITERRAATLSDLGFIPLVVAKDTQYAWFFNCPSVQRTGKYGLSNQMANINSRMSSMLHYILCVSRFGHFIKKIILNQRIGSLTDGDQIKKFISDKFLLQYCESNEAASTERKAAAPLRDFDVEIRQIPGRPGNYTCTVYLQPHYQFDYVEAKIRLDTEIAPVEP